MKVIRVAANLISSCWLLAGQADRLGSVEGLVIYSDTGSPVSGAAVTVYQPFYRVTIPGQPPQDTRTHTEFTDARGHFLIKDLQAWCYRLTVRMRSESDAPNLPYSDVCFGDGQALTGYRVRVTLSASAPGGLISTFPPRSPGDLTGNVVNGVDGAPIAHAAVTLSEPKQTPVYTDDQGHFEFQNMEPGLHVLNEPPQQRVIDFTSLLDSPIPYEIRMVGEGQQVSGVILRRYPPGALSGIVTRDSGRPAAGARVAIFRYRDYSGGQFRPAPSAETGTDEAGRYRIGNLPPGDYYVLAEEPGLPPDSLPPDAVGAYVSPSGDGTSLLYPPARLLQTLPNPPPGTMSYVPTWYSKAGRPAAVRVIGAEAGNTDIMLRNSRVTTIRGKLVDPIGAEAGTYNLTLRPADSTALGWSVGTAVMLSDGSFEIYDVPPGAYRLLACSTTGPGRRRWAAQTIEVKESPVDQIRLVLSAGREVKGSVKIEGSGAAPMSGVIWLYPIETADLRFDSRISPRMGPSDWVSPIECAFTRLSTP